ncbi:hypothetical protein PIROE2DRAFT_57693 [Piromyces sp. E2]|nr:hypothetical protein PIROE2DRAFT_57693 [Piromyces sp. E2]|eukprot:OUM69060.1 hypothetical protein PIROE2DRAFT_57693 [Piromyces sp. E2]
MLLRDNKKKERKEKVISSNNTKDLIENNIEYDTFQTQEINKPSNEETEYNSRSFSSHNENGIEVIPELQINELFLYWINLPNTQYLIRNYLKKIGIKKDIINNLDNCYFNPYNERLEKSERKKKELLDLQKFIFSIDYNLKKETSSTSNNNNNNKTYHSVNQLEKETDKKLKSIANPLDITKEIKEENLKKTKTTTSIIHTSKTLQKEKRKVRKLDSSTNTYINHLSTSFHKNYEKNNQKIEKETKEDKKDNILNNNNITNLTEIITESKENIYNNKATEKTMENTLLVEQTKNELNDKLIKENITEEEENAIYSKTKKYDSGVDISINSKPAIPRFYFPKGRPLEKNLEKEIEEQLQKIEELFKSANNNQLNEQEFWKVTEECELPRYISAALFKKVAGEPDDISQITVSFNNFKKEKYGGREDYLLQEDFYIVINDVVQYHPGLEFLSNMPIFQNRYIETVISRLFYNKPRNWNERMTLNEFRKVKFTQKLINLQDEDDDININRDIFSYKHFYVIYCKFWELDKDHDMKINRNELAKYDQFSMTPIMIDRVIEGYGKVTSSDGEILKSGWRDKIDDQKLNSNQPKMDNFSSLQEAFRNISIKNKNYIFSNLIKDYNNEDDPNIMLYKDFIWFILSAEDKGTTQAIEYWFRCLDLDGDGVISVFEIEQFWIEQYQRMIEWRTVDIWSFNDFLCYLLDMIQPENKNIITLADLKRSKNTPLFFDMLFDIKKYEMHLRCMDPLFREANEVWIVEGISSDNVNIDEEEKKIKLEGWEKFAERTYEQLAYEEMQAQQYQLSCQNYQIHKGKIVDTSYRHHRNSILEEDPFGPEIIDDFLEEDEEYSVCSEEDEGEEITYHALDQSNSNLINRNITFENYQEFESNSLSKN